MNTRSSFESFVKANGGPLYHQFLDARGLLCPEPLMLIRKNLRLMAESEILLVLCDDPTASRDVPNFCHFIGHQLLKMDQQLSELAFWIQKNDPFPPAF